MMEGINVLSLFDGMSCGQLALQRSGIKVNQYFASEVDKYAMQVTMKNFPNTIQLGDVRKVHAVNGGVEVDETDSKIRVIGCERIDLLCGGSPCQSFSFAGKMKGMATKCEVEITELEQYLKLKSEGYQFEGQSYLFWEYVRILTDLKKINPDIKFLLENVQMEERWRIVITRALGVNPIAINSNLVSAQNRDRLYWTNIGLEKGGLFDFEYSIIEQPKDLGLLIKDIAEDIVDEKYYLTQGLIDCFNTHKNKHDKEGNGFGWTPKTIEEHKKAGALTLKTGQRPADVYIKEVIQLNDSLESGGKQPYQQNRVYDANGLSPALMSQMSCGSHAILVQERVIGNVFDSGGTAGKVYSSDYKSPTVTGQRVNSQGYFLYKEKIRRLTPTECERLQTVPDGYTASVSDTQRYRMLGNGWTIDVISHIFNYLK